MKYRVHGSVTIGVSMVVEADSEEEALETANEEWPGLTNYAGNGARGSRLLGPYVDDTDPTVEAMDDLPIFVSAGKAE